MPDVVTAVTALTIAATASSSLKNAIDIGQKVKDWAKTKNDPEAQQMASDFLSALLDLQGDVLNLQQECFRLGEELRITKNHLEYRSKLIRGDAYYEFPEPVDGYGKGPFCLQCTDIKGIPISLLVRPNGYFHCSSCNTGGWLDGMEPPNENNEESYNIFK